MLEGKSIQTQAVHAGERAPAAHYRPVSTPIQMSVGYVHPSAEEMDRIFAGEEQGYVYPRYGSPTVAALERAMATLEGAGDAVAYGTGMAAVHAAILGAGACAGGAVVCAADVYGATYALVATTLASLGIRGRFVDVADLEGVQRALREERPAALVCEAISNPLLKVADLPALADLCGAAGARLIVDATFATPYLVRPLALGASYSVHSATKYLSGHGDVMAGVVACSAEAGRDLRERQKLLGANLGPQEAWLALRGLKTMPLRVREQCRNAQVVAEWLEGHPKVARVYYPGLPSHPQHDLASRLFSGKGYGGMISMDLRGAGRAEVFRFLEALDLVQPATTLGDVYSLVLYPAMSSHRALGPAERARLGIGEGLVRLSVGIEDPVDIKEDLDRALRTAL